MLMLWRDSGQNRKEYPPRCDAERTARGIFCSVLPYQQPHGVQQVFQIVAVQRVFNAGGVVRDVELRGDDPRLFRQGLLQLRAAGGAVIFGGAEITVDVGDTQYFCHSGDP